MSHSRLDCESEIRVRIVRYVDSRLGGGFALRRGKRVSPELIYPCPHCYRLEPYLINLSGVAGVQSLMQLIAAPLTEVFPDLPVDERILLARTLFSSVHGIVLLGVERRISAVPGAQLAYQIELLIRYVTSEPKS